MVVPPNVLLPMSEARFLQGDFGASQSLQAAGMTIIAVGATVFTLLNGYITAHFTLASRQRLNEISSHSQELGSRAEFEMLSLTMRKVNMSLGIGTVLSVFVVTFTLLLAYYPAFFINEELSKAYCLLNVIIIDAGLIGQSGAFAV